MGSPLPIAPWKPDPGRFGLVAPPATPDNGRRHDRSLPRRGNHRPGTLHSGRTTHGSLESNIAHANSCPGRGMPCRSRPPLESRRSPHQVHPMASAGDRSHAKRHRSRHPVRAPAAAAPDLFPGAMGCSALLPGHRGALRDRNQAHHSTLRHAAHTGSPRLPCHHPFAESREHPQSDPVEPATRAAFRASGSSRACRDCTLRPPPAFAVLCGLL